MPERGEFINMAWLLTGCVMIVISSNFVTSAEVHYGLMYGGLILVAGGPMVMAFAFEFAASHHDALVATWEPWMNGRRTIFVKKVTTMRHPDRNSGGKQFRSKVELAHPKFRHPKYGILDYFYADHDLMWSMRINNQRPGRVSYMGNSVRHRGVDGNVVFAEHPMPVVDDFRKVPVVDLVRGGWDYARQNGDLDIVEEAASPIAK